MVMNLCVLGCAPYVSGEKACMRSAIFQLVGCRRVTAAEGFGLCDVECGALEGEIEREKKRERREKQSPRLDRSLSPKRWKGREQLKTIELASGLVMHLIHFVSDYSCVTALT
jgi:hypothetical protein